MKKNFTLVAFVLLFTTVQALCSSFNNKRECRQAMAQIEKRVNMPFCNTTETDSCNNMIAALKNSQHLSIADKTRLQYIEENINKNAVGQEASPIRFVTPNGERHSLSDYNTPLQLLYFNDPDCESCHLVKSRLDTTQFIKTLVEQQQLTVIAIYPYDNEELWHESTMPTFIVNGWDKEQRIDNEETYLLPSMPLFYLIENGKIKVKNEPSLNQIVATLQALTAKPSPTR